MKLSDVNPTPLYDFTIPSTNARVKFRPFFVKEERALLAAYESEDANVMLNTLLQIVTQCIKPEPQNLTTFDIEYAFLQIRSKSVGEYTTLNFSCAHCDKVTPMNIDIRAATVVGLEPDSTIKLSDSLSVKMRYPTMDEILKLQNNTTDNLIVEVIAATIQTIFLDQEALDVADETDADLIAFTERLSSKQYAQLEEFMLSTPTVQLNVAWTCPGCTQSNETLLKGLNSFF